MLNTFTTEKWRVKSKERDCQAECCETVAERTVVCRKGASSKGDIGPFFYQSQENPSAIRPNELEVASFVSGAPWRLLSSGRGFTVRT